MKTRLVCLALAGLTLGLGCTDSHDEDPDAGGIVFDPRFADAGTDAGPPESPIGDMCTGDAECGDVGTCFTDWPDGYCIADCSAGEACPASSACVQVGRGTSWCLDNCDPTMLGADQCRPGYGCADTGEVDPDTGSPLGVCVPGCEEDSDCGGGLTCFPDGQGGSCRTAGTPIGAMCDGSQECGEGQSCIDERFGFPGGTCGLLFVDCDAATDAGCPTGSACLTFTARFGTFGACVAGCTGDSDCRAGYECTARDDGSSYCGPAFNGANLGQVCSAGRGDCSGGVCLSEGDTGWPDSYCVDTGCDPVANTGCPGDGVCVAGTDGTGICLDGCASATDCRAGYDCRPADLENPASPTACRPGCDDNSVCGNMGFVCNPGTGLCAEGFNPVALGEPCGNTADDCVGGRCLSEEDAGWPAGTCAYPGCRLSGTGPAITCPTGSVCVDDASGDPEMGVCVESCTMPTDCRPGYACTGGACVPGCTASDCGAGRTCNTTSGLCE